MKNIATNALLLILIIFSFSSICAQEKSKKQLKEEAKSQKEKQIKLLVDSKEFVFNVRMVIPQNRGNIEVSGDNYTVEYHLDTIKSDLPFFGRGFSGIGYGGDNGLVFKGKPENYSVEKTKKNYIIKTEVKGKQDYFSLLLSVYFNGTAYLTVNSNNRSSISYNGEIDVLKKK